MFDMFKARWTRATYLRTTMTKWQVAYFFLVDLSIIAVSVYGLIVIPWNNQLFICMLESILMALLVIVLGVIEKHYSKEIFMYTETPNLFKSAAEMQKYRTKKIQMALAKKLGKGGSFTNRKLEDLLKLFGERRCKSVGELRREGFEKVDDDRETYTWPVSPTEAQIVNDVNIKFTSADAYEIWDNVYTEGVTKPTHRDMITQCIDPSRQLL
jgi:hypothetical protein